MLKEVLVNQWINRMVEFALLRTVLWLLFPKMDLSPLSNESVQTSRAGQAGGGSFKEKTL